jgi:hypothetical protein
MWQARDVITATQYLPTFVHASQHIASTEPRKQALFSRRFASSITSRLATACSAPQELQASPIGMPAGSGIRESGQATKGSLWHSSYSFSSTVGSTRAAVWGIGVIQQRRITKLHKVQSRDKD